MIAQLVKRYGYYVCSNCRMQQHSLEEACWFCELPFSNYEEVMINKFKEEQENEINGEDKLRRNLCR